MVAYYPLIGDENEVVEQSATFQEDTMTIINAYNVTTHQESVDMLMMYRSIPKLVWIFLLRSFLTISALIKKKDYNSTTQTESRMPYGSQPVHT